MTYLDEAQLEIAVCDWLKAEPLGWEYVYGPEIAPDGDAPEREAKAGRGAERDVRLADSAGQRCALQDLGQDR